MEHLFYVSNLRRFALALFGVEYSHYRSVGKWQCLLKVLKRTHALHYTISELRSTEVHIYLKSTVTNMTF